LSAWGVLNNAGISRDPGANPFGGNQIPWLEQRVSSWADAHRGNLIVNDPEARFENALSAQLAPGTAPATTPGDPLEFKPWLKTERGITKNPKRIAPRRRKRLRGQHSAYADAFGDGAAVDTNAAPMSPAEQEQMRQTLTADWAAATPRTRGYRSSDWVAPKRTIQF
jgi:hypothetical protein